jgi:hypothetical protein
MAKAILEYDLKDADDLMEFTRANKSLDLSLCLWEIMYNTKKKFISKIEEDSFKSQDANELLDFVYDKFWEILNERNISLDELVN